MMTIRNNIAFYRDKLEFHKYESQINSYINKVVHEFTMVYKGIVNFKIREIFWDLVDERIEFDHTHWYHVFASMMGKIVMYDILFEEKIIEQFHKDIHNHWAGYLADLIIPHEPKLSKDFFGILIRNLPVPDYEAVLQLYVEGVILFEEDLKEILYNPQITMPKKILKFKTHFSNLFEILLAKCHFIDQEIAQYGGIAHKNSLHEIFQLNNSNERTPPEKLKQILIDLVHIRNGISHASHGGIVPIENKGIRIRDYKPDGTMSFERFFTVEQLYNYHYMILLLLMEFELVALMLTLHRTIREANIKYKKRLICSKCGHESVVYVYPGRPDVICNKCKTRFPI